MHYQQLEKYVPKDALPLIETWFSPFKIQLRITPDRKTKLGDYRKDGALHSISVNGNLSAEAFFFVLTHEFAHLKAYHDFRGKMILAHGKEWKHTFSELLLESVHLYPTEIQPYILQHARKPKASVTADPGIAKNLLRNENDLPYLEDLPEGSLFYIGNKLLQKGKKRKIRYLCQEKNTGKKYLVNGLAQVNRVKNETK